MKEYEVLSHFKLLLKLLGFSLHESGHGGENKVNSQAELLRWVKILLVNVSVLFYFFQAVYAIMLGTSLIRCLFFMFPIIQIYIYYLYFHYRIDNILGFIQGVETAYKQDTQSAFFIRQADKTIQRFIKFLLYFFTLNLNYIILGAGVKAWRPQLISSTFFDVPVPVLKSDLNWLAFPMIYLMAYPLILTITLSYIIMIMYTLHIQAQVDGILYKTSLLTKEVEDKKDVRKYKESQQITIMTKVIRNHASLIRMVDDMNKSISFPNLLLFLVSVIQCCLALYLSSMSTRLLSGPFECSWHELNPRVRKYMITYLIMANKGIKVAYRTILATNLQQFLQVLQYSYSYFTIIRNMETSHT